MNRIVLFLLFISTISYGQKWSLQYVDTKTDASFRGLSVANEHDVWVSGSKGWVGRTKDGGTTWIFHQVPSYEKCDFRTLYAFDSNNAIIANAGSPAYILRTTDGGTSWQQVYENTDSAAFIDGIAFWDHAHKKHGIIHGDPINGHMLLLYTKDRGKTWKERREKRNPKLSEGEASFAASGTAIRCFLRKTVVVATGGKTSKLYLSRNRGKRWQAINTPMLAGTASTGTYSFITGRTASQWFIAGGDYRQDTVQTDNFFYSSNKGKEWLPPVNTTRGYRECLAEIDNKRTAKKKILMTLFAVGPTGIDISVDDGVNWKPLSDEKGFHVIKPSADQNCLFLAGSNGKLAIMKLDTLR